MGSRGQFFKAVRDLKIRRDKELLMLLNNIIQSTELRKSVIQEIQILQLIDLITIKCNIQANQLLIMLISSLSLQQGGNSYRLKIFTPSPQFNKYRIKSLDRHKILGL